MPEPIPDVPSGVVRFYNILARGNPFLDQGHAGVDLRNCGKTIESGYSDAKGMDAGLHLNLLARINRELEGNFQPGRFTYHAFHDPTKGCVTMVLESLYSRSRPRLVALRDRSAFKAWQLIQVKAARLADGSLRN